MTPPEQSSLRAGHDDREKVVVRLNSAFAEGRLEVAELDERVAAAYRAKTLGELVPLTADLPASHHPPVPGQPVPRPVSVPAPRGSHGGGRGGHPGVPIAGALGLFLVNVLIWASIAIGKQEMVYFWPVWTAIPLVFALVGVIGQRRSR